MRFSIRLSGLSVVAALLAAAASATSIVPPRNLGELARASQVVVLGESVSSRVVRRGRMLFTETTFLVDDRIKGDGVASRGTKAPAGMLDSVKVLVPGGEIGGVGWAVSGAPTFSPGEHYLVMLNGDPDRYYLRMLAYGVLKQVRGRDGSDLLAPVAESSDLVPFARADGMEPEPIGTYRKAALVAQLAGVAAGTREWDAGATLASPAQLPLAVAAAAPPSNCRFMSDTSGHNLRWSIFDSNPPGQLAMYGSTTPDPSIADGGYGELQAALGIWNGAGSSLNLTYGGTTDPQMSCDANYNEASQDTPGNGVDTPPYTIKVVAFNDPCSDIPDLSGCSGILAFGGPWYSGSQTFDGTTWMTAISWFVVVNNGVGPLSGCLNTTQYTEMLAHELGHGLGFGHHNDSNALMYGICCHPLDSTDTACAQYAYPPAGPQPPPAPTGVAASDGAYTDRVRVTWNASAGADSYKVYRNTTNNSGSATQIGSPSASPYDDFTATAGTTYYYWVKATSNTTGDSSFSSANTGFAATIPGSPGNVSATDGDYVDHVRVTWNSVSGATSYKVFRNTTNNSGSATQIAPPPTVSGSPYDDYSAVAGTTYWYWVEASNIAGDSGFGGPDSGYARVCTAPTSPTASAPAVVASAQSYLVSWTATSQSNSYEVQEASNPAFTGPTTYSVSGLQRSFSHVVASATTFYYRVRASDCAGPLWSDYSNSASTNVIPCGAPPAPAISAPAAADSATSYTVSWTGTSPDNAYQLDEATNSGFSGATTFSVSGTSRNFSHTVASPTTYYYRVRATLTCAGTPYVSPYSTTGTTVVSPCVTPAAPVLTAPPSAPTGQSYLVSWTATSPDPAYTVQEATDPGFTSPTSLTLAGTSTQYTHSPAVNTPYYYRVKALNACGGTSYDSLWSSMGTTQVTVCTQPSAPGLVAPGAGATVPGPSVTLSWGAVAGATSYDVYFATGAVPAFVANIPGTSYGEPVSDGQSYSWKVVAKNACGQAESEVRGLYACSAPGAPVASFTWSPQGAAPGFPSQQQPYVGQAVHFTDLSTNSPTTWSWYDFQGVGIHYTVQNPTHTWTSTGAKNVRLQATNCAGTSTEKTIAVTVYADTRTVTADFGWSPSPAARNVAVTFTASQGYAFGDPTEFSWRFKDDNATADGPTATHTFPCGGTFDVVLTAKRGAYLGTTTRSVSVTGQSCCEAPGIPVAGFTWGPQGAFPGYPQQVQPFVGQQVVLTDTSTNSPTSWSWTGLPDAGAADDESPTVAWSSSGTYTVGLVASNCAGASDPASAQIVVHPDIRPVARRFDFGTAASPVADGYQQITPATTYTPAIGYGWTSGGVDARDRGVGNDLTRDFDFTSHATFAVDVPNGIYDVTVTSGDASSGHDEFGVSLDGVQLDALTTGAGEWVAHTYQVAVEDGQLVLLLDDLGGADGVAVINALTVVTASTRRFDFGIDGSPVEPGYVGVPNTLRYADWRGYGWLSGTVGGRDRGTGTALTRDLNFTSLATFAVDVPNGAYDVTVRLGDMGAGHDLAGVYLEGAYRDSVTTTAGEIAVRTYRTTVADGQLSLLLDDLGGADSSVAIVGLEVAPAVPPALRIVLPGHVVSGAAGIAAGTSPGPGRISR